MESKYFAEAIGRRRIEADLTQEALARKAGINRTTYGSIERGQTALSEENLLRLSIALGARVEDILAEACHVLHVSLLTIEPEVRAQMGVAPREGEEKDKGEPVTLIHSFVDSLRDLLVTLHSPRRDPASIPFASPSPPPPGATGKPRRRASSSRKRKPQRR